MPSQALLKEAQHLRDISARLDLLAERHPKVLEALISISVNVRNAATTLEVLVTTKLEGNGSRRHLA